MNLEILNKEYQTNGPRGLIGMVLEHYRGESVFSTSLQAEDQVVTHMLCGENKQAVDFITLDTGRMFEDIYHTLHRTNQRYGIDIRVMFPHTDRVEEMVKEKGINLFYESVENRKLCCHIRKTEPLVRALQGYKVWITGLRREQSVTRNSLPAAEWDKGLKMIKINPLVDFSYQEVWQYIRENKVPYPSLHDNGYPSIGCAPCTRKVEKGEGVRAGRWWWENPESKECGLHLNKNG